MRCGTVRKSSAVAQFRSEEGVEIGIDTVGRRIKTLRKRIKLRK